MKVPMGPPPPKNPNPNPEPVPPGAGDDVAPLIGAPEVPPADDPAVPSAPPLEESPAEPTPPDSSPSSGAPPPAPQHERLVVPYTIPPWSDPPGHPFALEVLKDGAIIEQHDVSKKGAYMFGRIDLCDFVLEHPTISRFHAVLQFRKDGEAFIYDLGSTHGTSVNKKQVKKKVYTEVHVGDVIRFGHSSRLYIFQGPSELMPPEADLDKIWRAKTREEVFDREASLLRAKNAVSLADGISWGIDEDAVEEAAENDAEEVTWQTYKGQLTERQEKTRGKIIKRMEKVANMKKEIDAIRVKDISQGGLTQGQQTQIARNEQRISQIMEELDNLEETLNESIQESLGARYRKIVHGRKKENVGDDNDILSDDDDEFYDRTKKPTKKSVEQQSVETADTLLDKKEAIINEMEEMKKLLLKEKEKLVPDNQSSMEAGDDLDAYMSGLSSQLVIDRTIKIEKDLSNLQTELDKIIYLLKIADPVGEAARNRDVNAEASKSNKEVPDVSKQLQNEQKDNQRPERTVILSKPEKTAHSTKAENSPEEVKDVFEKKEGKIYTVTKPQWLGDIKGIEPEENHVEATHLDDDESGNFVDYKDRNRALGSVDHAQEIENAAPGLIIRKRKLVENPEEKVDKASKVNVSSSAEAGTTAADAVALLLKHERGYYASDGGTGENEHISSGDKSGKKSKPKRVLGPSRPDFLDKGADYESWVPPEGQSGDGRTSLNDRLGY